MHDGHVPVLSVAATKSLSGLFVLALATAILLIKIIEDCVRAEVIRVRYR